MSETRVGCEFLVTKAELVKHFSERAEHHEGKVKVYAEQLAQLKTSISPSRKEEIYLPNSIHSNIAYSQQNLVDQVDASVRSHEKAAKKFNFYAKHVACDMWLSQADLVDLEFCGI